MPTEDGIADAEARTSLLDRIALHLPEAQMVVVEAWGHPTYRVRGRNFVFAASDSSGVSLKLRPDEAAWVVGNVPGAEPAGYGLGRHGWVSIPTPPADDAPGWQQLGEWVRESYGLVAPRTLARSVLPDSPS